MRTCALIVLLLCAAFGRAADDPAKPPPSLAIDATTPPPNVPLPANMKPLFDGKSLDGWAQIPADSWTIKNNILASVGAARGAIYTKQSFGRYRVVFDVRHNTGKPDHRAGVLVFCTAPAEGEKPMDALAGIQFQVPNGGHWDYRKGHNNAGNDFFKRLVNPKFDEHQWSRVEILVDPTTGTARMAVAQPVGTPAVEVLQFKDPTAGKSGPFALQMHNKGLFDEFANVAIELEPAVNDLITVQPDKKPLAVFILAGQSNMEGKAKMELLDYQVKQPQNQPIFGHFQKDGKWIEREDVWIKFLDRKGNLTVGYGSPNCIGPELEFGHVVGDHYEQQVLLIKTAWGGRSLYRDFRPPSSGLPPDDVLAKMLAQMQKKTPTATLDDIKKPFGSTYRDMMKEISSTLSDLKTNFPAYQNQGYELHGFIWFQGWNDMIDDAATAEYSTNLAHFIQDVRGDLKSANLPFVIAQMGVGGVEGADAKIKEFKAAQAAVMDRPEGKNNVALVKADQFWDMEADAVFKKGWRENLEEWNTVGSDYPYHYLGSAKTYCRIGKALAEAAIALDAKNR